MTAQGIAMAEFLEKLHEGLGILCAQDDIVAGSPGLHRLDEVCKSVIARQT
jgi:hypothetical protein